MIMMSDKENIDIEDNPELEQETILITLSYEDTGERLDKILANKLSQYSRTRIKQWIDDGFVTKNGQKLASKTIMHGNETITIYPQTLPETLAFQPEFIDLSIVYEDKDILVINKQANLVVHPAAGNWSGTLLNGLLYHYPELSKIPRAGIVHRLDKDTTGLLVVAKTTQAQTELVRQLQDRTVHRQYLALVLGSPPLQGQINAPIARHPKDRVKMAVSESENAKPALTHYSRVAQGNLFQYPVSLISCRLETGRTHQIRVHMQSLGFPLIGDQLYGKPHISQLFHRQALHAYRLGLIHPISKKALKWEADLPDDFTLLLKRSSIKDWKKI